MEWIAVITAGIAAVTSLVTLLLNRRFQRIDRAAEKDDECKATLDRIEKKLDAHISSDMEASIKQGRTQFLIFADELSRGIPHSREHFEAVIKLVDDYDRYCKDHPKFPNSKARAAEALIRDTYQNKLAKGDWLS